MKWAMLHWAPVFSWSSGSALSTEVAFPDVTKAGEMSVAWLSELSFLPGNGM